MSEAAFDIFLPDPEATDRVGREFGRRAMQSGHPLNIHLAGNLGAGKTALVRGWLRGMGYEGTVRSPTYTLLELYETKNHPVAHLDLYRLVDPEELEFLGLRELTGGSHWLLVEWPERGAGHLPLPDIRVGMVIEGAGRRLRLEPASPAGAAWIAALPPVEAHTSS